MPLMFPVFASLDIGPFDHVSLLRHNYSLVLHELYFWRSFHQAINLAMIRSKYA